MEPWPPALTSQPRDPAKRSSGSYLRRDNPGVGGGVGGAPRGRWAAATYPLGSLKASSGTFRKLVLHLQVGLPLEAKIHCGRGDGGVP